MAGAAAISQRKICPRTAIIPSAAEQARDAFLVIRGENVRMLPVAEPASTSVDRLIELLPDLLEKGEAYFAEKKAAKEAEKAAEEA